ncbi:MAG: hypothetical protein IJA10_13810 [Lachnospiraceae bacterium]|nr:hypothetical protein [Lachnospiraceae bacterium]
MMKEPCKDYQEIYDKTVETQEEKEVRRHENGRGRTSRKGRVVSAFFIQKLVGIVYFLLNMYGQRNIIKDSL